MKYYVVRIKSVGVITIVPVPYYEQTTMVLLYGPTDHDTAWKKVQELKKG